MQTQPSGIKKVPLPVLLVGIIVPLVFLLLGAYKISTYYLRINSWDTVIATVTSSEIQESEGTNDGVKTIAYGAKINYNFDINGKTFSGSYESLYTDSLSSAQQIVASYPVGQQITIKVDPENPEKNFLPINDTWFWWIFVATGGFFLAIFGRVMYRLKQLSNPKTP